jgi:eukaryotic-like serine/threonine-protein kinase
MPSLESGIRIAHRYVLQERLGDGGHAEVWAAIDSKDQQRVALKFLHAANGGGEEAWQFLQHESSIVHRLDHPGVLHVSAPQRDGNTVFLAMEFVGGGNATKLRGAAWQQIVPLLREVAEILEHVHSRGVVHRDIKTGNVMFTTDGAVRLADFGTSARTGSAAALAVGSPYSSSPQQLAGESAVIADDIYGLGALAYELLCSYPPYYPNFDAQRMQNEAPARCIPVHAAPVALIDLVMSMLALQAEQRPDLAQIMQQLAQISTGAAQEDFPQEAGSQLIRAVNTSAVLTTPLRERAKIPPSVWLAAAAVLAVLAFVWLPKLAPIPDSKPLQTVVTGKAMPPVVNQPVPNAAANRPAAVVKATPQDEIADAILRDLQAGDAALTAMKPAEARAAFQRVLRVQSNHAAAKQGLLAAAELEQVLTAYAAGTKAEAAGDWAMARSQYESVLKSRRGFQPALDGMSRLGRLAAAKQLESLLAQGNQALLTGRVQLAETAYTAASRMSPTHPQVIDGLARVQEIRTNQLNAKDLDSGMQLERAERWNEALTVYQSALNRDSKLLFAQDGVARVRRRAALDAELADYLARPERLTASAVRSAADRALARAEATTPRTTRLAEQMAALQSKLAVLTVPVRVELRSDNVTRVYVAPLGDLGTFASREVQLPAGNYTIIGRRDGYRDVRHEVSLGPDQKLPALTIVCGDRI